MISQDIRDSRLRGHLNQVAKKAVRLANQEKRISSTQSKEGTLDNYSRQSVCHSFATDVLDPLSGCRL